MNLRAEAARVILAVLSGKSLSESLPPIVKKFSDPRNGALVQAICFGVCRWFYLLDHIANQLLHKPLRKKDQDVYALLLVGLYQLHAMQLPDYAVIADTVEGAVALKKIWAKNVINALLREYQRSKTTLLATLQQHPVAYYVHPQWMIDTLQRAYPNDWQAILTANNQHPPFTLRVNAAKISREQYLKKLAMHDIKAAPLDDTVCGIVLESPMDVTALPGFSAGEVSVQDGAAQCAASWLQLAPHLNVLDACAAPGGKMTHLLETEPTLQLTAVDRDATRLQRVKQNCQRLHLPVNIQCADVADVNTWWDGQLFDRILFDAPCSGSGVIRRHPDIKLLRRAADIAALPKEQERLLKAVWPLLKKDGLLLYATCSIFPEENDEVIEKFLRYDASAQNERIPTTIGRMTEWGLQILPGAHNFDGFYYACLRKK